MTNWLKGEQQDLKNLEKLIREKTYIKNIVEQIFEVNQNDYVSLRKDVQTLLGDVGDLFGFLINGYERNDTLDVLLEAGYSEEYSIWLWGLSIRYGRIIWKQIELDNMKYDWKEMSTRLIVNENPLLEISLTRYDNQELKLEVDKYSALQLIDRLTNGIGRYFAKGLDNSEKELTKDIIRKLYVILDENDSNS